MHCVAAGWHFIEVKTLVQETLVGMLVAGKVVFVVLAVLVDRMMVRFGEIRSACVCVLVGFCVQKCIHFVSYLHWLQASVFEERCSLLLSVMKNYQCCSVSYC